jgi:septal ring-binding cell division protein DamX
MAKADQDEKTANSDRGTRFAVQLELACETPSLTEAFAHDQPAGTMWVVKTSYRGRTCFRVLWGRYPDRDAAERGLSAAPSFFSTSRNHPMVVPVR